MTTDDTKKINDLIKDNLKELKDKEGEDKAKKHHEKEEKLSKVKSETENEAREQVKEKFAA